MITNAKRVDPEADKDVDTVTTFARNLGPAIFRAFAVM